MITPLTKIQVLESMIVEAKNDYTRSEILNSLYTRQSLRGQASKNQEMMGQNQSRMRHIKALLTDLEDMHKDELALISKEKHNKTV